jgi:hypothetical protein
MPLTTVSSAAIVISYLDVAALPTHCGLRDCRVPIAVREIKADENSRLQSEIVEIEKGR